MFFEHHEEMVEHSDIVAPDSPARFPFTQTVARLAEAPELSRGRREIQLGNPALRTIALHVTRLEAGASFEVTPTTLNCIYAIMQGTGEAKIDDKVFTFARGDVIAAPSSTRQTWTAKEQCYLLRVSDEPLLTFLNWLRPVEV
jgi:gentisate 1,2-dioxygenase